MTGPVKSLWNKKRRGAGWRRWLLYGCLSGCVGLARAQQYDPLFDTGMNPQDWQGFDRYFGTHPVERIPDEGTRYFRVGATVGLNIRSAFHETGQLLNNAPEGIFLDGYVLNDQYNNAASSQTANFGFQNANQYNAPGAPAGTLTFHRVDNYVPEANGANSDAGPSAGFDLAYGGYLWRTGKIRVGLEFGFGLMPITVFDHETFTASASETAYSYTVGQPFLVTAPYYGSATTTGQLINSNPLQVQSSGNSLTTAMISGTRRLDAILYSFRLGPSFHWDLNRNWAMSAGVGPVIGVIPAEYRYNEVVTTAGNGTTTGGTTTTSGSFFRSDFVWGGDFNATLYYHTRDQERDTDLFLSVQYMPLSSATFSDGGRTAKLNLEGQVYISAGVSWPF